MTAATDSGVKQTHHWQWHLCKCVTVNDVFGDSNDVDPTVMKLWSDGQEQTRHYQGWIRGASCPLDFEK
jgi:hypothetical protein